jgi:transposase
VFLDEFGCNTAMTRHFARALQGQRAFGSCPVNYGPNVSVAGAIRLDGVVAALIVDGAFDGEAFVAFTQSVLAPCLRADDVVVMDNLASHKVSGVVEAIEAVGARVMYLPPYSPDFNPIEMCWSKVKEYLRAQAARTSKALDDAIARGLDLVTLSDLSGWFGHCGYANPA